MGKKLTSQASSSLSGQRVIAIDGGRTKTKAALLNEHGTITRAVGPGLEIIGHPSGQEQVEIALRATLSKLNAQQIDTVCIGMNGFQVPSRHQETIVRILRSILDVRRVIVTSDVVTSYCGAFGLQPGIVIAAGTGAISMGLETTGTLRIRDGHGYLLGDRGSGFTIGSAGLNSAIRHFDGVAGSQALGSEVHRIYGSVDSLVARTYSSTTPAPLIASFARSVARCAAEGDLDSIVILRHAGQELAETAHAIAEDLGYTRSHAFEVRLAGGLFDIGELIIDPIRSRLSESFDRVTVGLADGDAVSGGLFLAREVNPVLTDRVYWHSLSDDSTVALVASVS